MLKTTRLKIAGLAVAVATLGNAQTVDEALAPVDHPAIRYNQTVVNDRVTRLLKDLKSGKTKLVPTADGSYLTALLRAFDVNPDSQALVFSKTSFQASRISPKNPRAIYFSDDMTVGFVRGSNLLEIGALDPTQGVVFYSFDQESMPPRFDRRDVCLQCHESKGTLGVPGLMVASVYPDADGMPAFKGAQNLTDHRTRFEDRWGGWYVTGTHGEMRHLGNAVGHEPDHPEVLDTHGTLNLTSLLKKLDPTGYLSPLSDIVALMTLEHQTRMTDLMIRVGWEARVAAYDAKEGKQDAVARARYEADLESMVAYMLFADESPLQDAVQGVSTFTKTFPERGPRDQQGRSLRDFDLRTRLFRYPLSYMVYSEAFDGMPALVRDQLYRRLYDILTGKDQSPKFKRLTAEDRRAIFEILRETKSDLPGYWTAPETALASAR
ncbi:MAG TPA: hypothetical protein VGN17_08365 [Bryobacteraceae bacterium]|jgi:hypothetical protein